MEINPKVFSHALWKCLKLTNTQEMTSSTYIWFIFSMIHPYYYKDLWYMQGSIG